MISIKEVTKQTGITVRTMRYYDQIDLLRPAGKTEGGHRLYGEKEIKKLQEIQFLKTIGFGLQEIKEMLADENHDWFAGLKNQLDYISKEKERLGQIEGTLRGLINEIMLNGNIDLSNMQKLIQLYQQNMDKREGYLNQTFNEEESKLLQSLPNINREDPETLEWIALIAQLKKHMSKGISSPEIQRLIKRMYEKEQEDFGDNKEFIEKVWEIRKSPQKSESAGFYPIDSETLNFFEEAYEFYLNKKGNL
ncbi:MerR family transcriptional regulator [Oceanobacillus neutriphilus]|uniref:MerR family transcriptional regulator n=1 Tax=Oceanobacillus neutriphilus TaxID=531815 RepID=A0ABQ2NPP6_9BACI|nr:MerR family transcriptional regulator [Oceanobacillus neutriphilus]GGP08611.1 MerR family transcriptional regulator [Oceanobacillus neutriphilus]